ncbi:MAG: ribosome silencing factor [Bacteroidales bacterium]|nr:ribosome silencing factor [Bacteroidales bacterium]
MIENIIRGILEKKGRQVTCIDLTEVENAACGCFVICHGDSRTQVNAIAESVEKETRTHGHVRPYSIEGTNNGEWVLLDYGNAVVHIFQQSVRERYKLEELWGDGKITHINELNSH